jgi:hypothetical protein
MLPNIVISLLSSFLDPNSAYRFAFFKFLIPEGNTSQAKPTANNDCKYNESIPWNIGILEILILIPLVVLSMLINLQMLFNIITSEKNNSKSDILWLVYLNDLIHTHLEPASAAMSLSIVKQKSVILLSNR